MENARQHHYNVKEFYRLQIGFLLCAAFKLEQYKKCGKNQAFDGVNMWPTCRVRSQRQVDWDTTEWFSIPKRCKTRLHPISWSVILFREYVINTAGVGKVIWKTNTVTHADDTTVLVQTRWHDWTDKMRKHNSESLGLKLNL